MKEKIFAGGSILTAILASSCCIGPLILAAVGMSGLSFLGPLAKYRPIFIGITFALIGVSYYFTYGRKKTCCSGEATRRRWAQEVPLWVITAVAVGLVAFTYTKEYLGSKEASLESKGDYKIVSFQVEGITCAGCVKTIKTAIFEVRGVKAVDVDLKGSNVRVGFMKDLSSIPIQEVLETLEKKGYNGHFTSR